jgi:mono/diheme cytochrome c family protein
MFRTKLLAIIIFVLIALLACSGGKADRYVIADSKTYEASMFRQNCAICHGPEAMGKTLEDGKQIPNLREPPYKYKTEGEIYDHIAKGGNGMVPFAGQLSDREIRMMVGFVMNDLRKKQ